MKVEIDPYSGFCFGVVYAIEKAEEEKSNNQTSDQPEKYEYKEKLSRQRVVNSSDNNQKDKSKSRSNKEEIELSTSEETLSNQQTLELSDDYHEQTTEKEERETDKISELINSMEKLLRNISK